MIQHNPPRDTRPFLEKPIVPSAEVNITKPRKRSAFIKKAVGREEKLKIDKVSSQILQMSALGLKLYQMADIFGITPECLSRYFKKYPELKRIHEIGKTRGAYGLKAKAYKLAQDGDKEMIKYVLKNISDWSEQNQLNQNTAITNIINSPFVIETTDDSGHTQQTVFTAKSE